VVKPINLSLVCLQSKQETANGFFKTKEEFVLCKQTKELAKQAREGSCLLIGVKAKGPLSARPIDAGDESRHQSVVANHRWLAKPIDVSRRRDG
jgi:hypothetical protein